jgi:hypothetical protein
MSTIMGASVLLPPTSKALVCRGASHASGVPGFMTCGLYVTHRLSGLTITISTIKSVLMTSTAVLFVTLLLQYVAAKLGPEFTEPPPWTLDDVFPDTSCRTPIIFILSTGADPTNMLQVRVCDNDGGGKISVDGISWHGELAELHLHQLADDPMCGCCMPLGDTMAAST